MRKQRRGGGWGLGSRQCSFGRRLVACWRIQSGFSSLTIHLRAQEGIEITVLAFDLGGGPVPGWK